MNIEFLPLIDYRELADAVELQYGWTGFREQIRGVLFGDNYHKACIKQFNFSKDTTGFGWWDNGDAAQEAAVKAYLRDIFPCYST